MVYFVENQISQPPFLDTQQTLSNLQLGAANPLFNQNAGISNIFAAQNHISALGGLGQVVDQRPSKYCIHIGMPAPKFPATTSAAL